MKISDIVKKMSDEKIAHVVRYKRNTPIVPLSPIEYDAQPFYDAGKKKGWALLDITTAHAMNTVYNALSEDGKKKFDCIPLPRLVAACWNSIK